MGKKYLSSLSAGTVREGQPAKSNKTAAAKKTNKKTKNKPMKGTI